VTRTTAPHRELGLTDSEYEGILAALGREPNQVELAVFSLMWSEHCGYKHSKKVLRSLPTEGPRVVMGPGENAGAVDVGGGLACAFKVESHNHPSAVEPFQGAATGVGGILATSSRSARARSRSWTPCASASRATRRARATCSSARGGDRALRQLDRRWPTVGGEIYFEEPYEHNCLVNAMCLGLIETERLIRSRGAGSATWSCSSGADRAATGSAGPSVLRQRQLGTRTSAAAAAHRPDRRSVRGEEALECSLELLERELLVSSRTSGAAGLTSSASEMASKGEVGIDLDVRRSRSARPGMEPFEIMISESQERMLCVVEPDRVDDVIASASAGRPARPPSASSRTRAACACSTTAWSWATCRSRRSSTTVPVYDLEPSPPSVSLYPPPAAQIEHDAAPRDVLVALLGSANLASRRWAFEQYDCLVGSATVRRPEAADAAVLRLPDTSGALGVSIDGNGRRVAIDPYRGAVEAVVECSANLACVGAEPLGLTNCLNFGNPEKPHIAWQLTRAVAGLADACRALGVPVVGGNVSLYNEGGGGPIYPTPVVGMVGELPDAARAGRLGFAEEGDTIALIAASSWAPSLTGSELAKLRGEALEGALPAADLGELRATHAAVRQAVRSGALRSAHDVAEGGLAIALAECCVAGGLGARVQLPGLIERGQVAGHAASAAPGGGLAPAEGAAQSAAPTLLALLFGEGPGAFVVSGPAEALRAFGGAAVYLGTVGGEALVLGELSVPVAELAHAHAHGLADLLH
jgi:phosphoribosylformylglycinamidine synthase